jgi:flagella basal body P-ring formation protein FlgA
MKPRILTILLLFALLPMAVDAAPPLETRLEQMLAELYGSGEDIQVKIDSLPQKLQHGSSIRNVSLLKVPESGGSGMAMVEFKSPDGKQGSAYVPFKVFGKKKLLYVKRAMKKGAQLSREDLGVRETLITERGTLYPGRTEEVAGRTLTRAVGAGTVITYPMIDSQQGVKRGEIVTIVCDNQRLMIRARGKAMENGKRGDVIRVRNIPSDREVVGRVTDSGTVAVEF